VELVDHHVDRVLQFQDLAAALYGDLPGEVTASHGRGYIGDIADLSGQVRRHGVHAVGQVLPGPGDAANIGLDPKSAVERHLSGATSRLGGKGVQLIDHHIDRVLQGQDLPPAFDGDLPREVAACDRRRHVGNVADLVGQVDRHQVHAVGQVLPGAGDAAHVG